MSSDNPSPLADAVAPVETGLTISGDWLYAFNNQRIRLSSVVGYSRYGNTLQLNVQSRDYIEVTLIDKYEDPNGTRSKAALAQLDQHFLLTSMNPR